RDLLHDFVLLVMPMCLVCADGGHIKCIRHSTLCGITTVDGKPSDMEMQNVAYVPQALHTLISLQQLLDAGCCITFDQIHGFHFFLNNQLRLLSYCSGNL